MNGPSLRPSILGLLSSPAGLLALAAVTLALPGSARGAGQPQLAREARERFIAKGPFHRVMLPASSSELANLVATGAVLWTEDYGLRTLVYADARRVPGGVPALLAAGLDFVDEMTLVDFNGYRIDGADSTSTAASLATIPAILRAPDIRQAGARLRVLQFIGPVREVWLDALRGTGAFIVTYAANNAYVVKCDGAASAALDLLTRSPFVLSLWEYEPAFKLRKQLRPPQIAVSQLHRVIVQVIADGSGSDFVETLRARTLDAFPAPVPVLNYINVELLLDSANVFDLARDPHVFAIEPKPERSPLDERQGQIVAGQLDPTGTQPAGPTYLAWLQSQGFPGMNPFPFVVDVVDTGLDVGENTIRASINSAGAQSEASASKVSMSGDGRYVAFSSPATNLVPGDTNGASDVFLRDLALGLTSRLSVDSSGAQSAGLGSEEGAISFDGHTAAFFSWNNDLVPGDTNGTADVFVRDLVAGTTTRVSVGSGGGEANGGSFQSAISADGQFVAFNSVATNLVPGDTNGSRDIFLRDRSAGTTVRVSVTSSGGQVFGDPHHRFSISNDGRYVAFTHFSNDFYPGDVNGALDVFVRDVQSGITSLISVDSAGNPSNHASLYPSISSDGRYIAFESFGNNLVAGDSNNRYDVFVHDRQVGATTRVSVSSAGVEGNHDSRAPVISADGRFVAFLSKASNLISNDTNGSVLDVFLHDRTTGSTSCASVNSAGEQGDYDNFGDFNVNAAISSDGRLIAYINWSTNLVPDDTNNRRDVFVHSPPNDEFRVNGVPSGASRVAYSFNYTSDARADDVCGHGTLDASIVFGHNANIGSAHEDALGYQYGLGVAPWVKVGNSKVFGNSGFAEPTATRMANAYNNGARISSNSWGGGGNDYSSDSQDHDVAVRDAVLASAGNQEMTIVFAAGNGGPFPASVISPGTAKNVITVGASENWRMTGTDGCGLTDFDADNAADIAGFSSRGPTSDLRLKPEILAPGTHIQGAASRSTNYNGSGVCNLYWPPGQTRYTWASGTSQATPAVAGACALVHQRLLNLGRGAPSPALTKALIVTGAQYMTGSGANDSLWSINQGMGRVDLERTLRATARGFFDQRHVFHESGESYRVEDGIFPAAASPGEPFRVVLAWTDAPGLTTGNAWSNNLDLEVEVNGVVYKGNVFSGAASVPGGTADSRNNLESVFLPAGVVGSFSVTVHATNIVADGVPGNADLTDQDFALVVYNFEKVSRVGPPRPLR